MTLPLLPGPPEPRECLCGTPVPKGPLIHGYGSGCARKHGLTPPAIPRPRSDAQDGPTLLDVLATTTPVVDPPSRSGMMNAASPEGEPVADSPGLDEHQSMDGDAASIVTFLRARYDDEETSTRNLLYWAQQTILTLEEPKLLGTRIPGWHAWPDVERMCQDRLTDLDSKRAILDQYEDARRRSTPGGYDTIDYVEDALDTVVRHLAAPFAAHPDYQESWKP